MSQKVPVLDDAKDRLSVLVESRLPWLVIGLLGGLLSSVLVSRFEEVLEENISLAFFLPVIVYITDAVGTQTVTICVRRISEFRSHFREFLLKEFFIGLVLGVVFGLLVGMVARIWLGSTPIALTVGLAVFANVAFAPVVALLVPEILSQEHTDPALGAGPFTTVIQGILSILIYFLIATVIL